MSPAFLEDSFLSEPAGRLTQVYHTYQETNSTDHTHPQNHQFLCPGLSSSTSLGNVSSGLPVQLLLVGISRT